MLKPETKKSTLVRWYIFSTIFSLFVFAKMDFYSYNPIFGTPIELRLLEDVIAIDEAFCIQGISATLTILDNGRKLYVDKDNPTARTRFPYRQNKEFEIVVTCHIEENTSQNLTLVGKTDAHAIAGNWGRPLSYLSHPPYNFHNVLSRRNILRHLYPRRQWIGVFERPVTDKYRTSVSYGLPTIIQLSNDEYRIISIQGYEEYEQNHLAIAF